MQRARVQHRAEMRAEALARVDKDREAAKPAKEAGDLPKAEVPAASSRSGLAFTISPEDASTQKAWDVQLQENQAEGSAAAEGVDGWQLAGGYSSSPAHRGL
jgi:hypothetical protein